MLLRILGGALVFLPILSFVHLGQAPAVVLPPDGFPKNYFQLPVRSGLRLSGTFGELRANHFHAGIDISSASGSIGQPIYAAADGFIDRIRVEEGGYGKALYIKHPNGYTTLYAHLDKFSPEVERLVKENQYKRERFEINLYPADGSLKVKQGDIIGKMGNSGGSEGPHLHFEIRNSASQKALNPLLFGLPIPDQVPPELRDMKVYFLNEKREPISSKPFPIERRKDGSYGVPGDTVWLPAWRVGFGLKTIDRSTGNTQNQNGIYALTMLTDDKTAFQWKMTELDFDETRYLNAHSDFSAHERYGAWFHRCFVLPGDLLSNYSRTESLGAVALYKDRPVKVTIQAVDALQNQSSITFWVQRDEVVEPAPRPPYQLELPYDVENRIDMEGFSLTLPKGTLYETLYFEYEATPSGDSNKCSALHHVHNETVPLHRSATLSIQPQALPEALRSKACIARLGKGRPVNCGGSWRADRLETRMRDFGDYAVVLDTVPPSVVPISFGPDMRRKQTLAFRLRDNFRTDAAARNLRYRATVDGQWVLFEYDRKNARLSHSFDGRIGPGEHTLKLVVTDDRDNTTVFERKFLR